MNILPPMVFDVATVKCERKLGRDESEKAADDHRRDFNEAVLGKRQNNIFLIGLALHQKEQQLPRPAAETQFVNSARGRRSAFYSTIVYKTARK